jgi:hypothetical protein
MELAINIDCSWAASVTSRRRWSTPCFEQVLDDAYAKQLQAHGYGIEGYGEMKKLRISHSELPKARTQYGTETREQERALDSLKRTYTVKLFAEGEEARTLLSSLATEIAENYQVGTDKRQMPASLPTCP